MSKAEVIVAGTATGVGVTPAVLKAAEVPFYETSTWVYSMAVMAGVVLFLTMVNSLFKTYLNAKQAIKAWSGKERRHDKR